MRSKQNEQKQQARLAKRKKRKKKKSEEDSIASSDCDSDLQLPSSKRAKSIETNELNAPHEPNETNSQYEETADFNETIEHCIIKFKETISEVKPPEPTIKKKEKPPPFNYVLLKNVSQVNKFSKPAIDSIHNDVDDANDENDADDDYDADDYDYDDVEYQYDEYYDGVGEDHSTSIFANTKPTSSTSRSTTSYEETPLEKVSQIAFPARFVAGRRQVTPSNKRKRILPQQSASSKQSNIPSSDLETVNNNEFFVDVECQDCNSIEPRRSDRKRKLTEKFASFTEDKNKVKYAKDNNRVPSDTAKVSTSNNSNDATVNSNDDDVDADIIKNFDIASSQNQFNKSQRPNIEGNCTAMANGRYRFTG